MPRRVAFFIWSCNRNRRRWTRERTARQLSRYLRQPPVAPRGGPERQCTQSPHERETAQVLRRRRKPTTRRQISPPSSEQCTPRSSAAHSSSAFAPAQSSGAIVFAGSGQPSRTRSQRPRLRRRYNRPSDRDPESCRLDRVARNRANVMSIRSWRKRPLRRRRKNLQPAGLLPRSPSVP